MDKSKTEISNFESLVNPLCIILVKNGSKGDRLLFRYPFNSRKYDDALKSETTSLSGSNRKSFRASANKPSNPYETSQLKVAEDFIGTIKSLQPQEIQISENSSPWGSEMLAELSDKDLSNLLAVNSDLAERKFELKLNGVRFVGHPTLMQDPKEIRPMNTQFQTSVKLFHIVFCLNAMASHSIVKSFYDLSKRLGIGLRHEEYRCGFLNKEIKSIIKILDAGTTEQSEDNLDEELDGITTEKTFNHILTNSILAHLMKKVYDDVCETGFVKFRINNWVQISFCLPQKIHCLPYQKEPPLVEPEAIHRCLEAIRPYHAILLLVDRDELFSNFPTDASSAIPRLLQVHSPLKSLQVIAADADLTLSHIVEIASHLVYWAKATVVYPICEENVYVIAPDAPITSPELDMAFSEAFSELSLSQTLADFSLPMPLGERVNPVVGGIHVQAQLIQLVSWMLKSRLLIQLHTYIYLDTYQESPFGSFAKVDIDMNNRLFEGEDLDDSITLGDSFSEITGDDESLSPSSPLRTLGEKGKSEEEAESVDEPFEKFKGTLSEVKNGAVRRAIGMIKSPISIHDVKMFTRLAKYFTGDFHLEEIMYREDVRRSQLMLLLDKFREVLITSEKEDPDINFFKANKW